ncbi:MAG: protease HtpX [Gammaproteobacteria bacterium]
MLRIFLFLLTNIAVLAVGFMTLSLLGFNGFMQANGVDLDLQQLLLFCAVFGFAGALVSLFMSKWMAKRFMGVQLIEQPRNQTEQWLHRTVKELADQAGIGMPEVGIFDAPESNAFATGWNRNNALVAVSTGLLSRFKEDEARAVLAHEIGHVANGDMVTMTLIQGVVNTFVMFFARIIGHTVDRVVFKTEEGHGPAFYIVSFIAEIILAILATMIVMAFSRWREYRADAAGAHLAGTGPMIRALERLRQEHEAGVEVHMPDTMRAFGIAGGLGKMFASHPPLEKRIEALRNAA